MLQNAYLLAKIGADTAENEQHLPKICQKLTTTLRGRPEAQRCRGRAPGGPQSNRSCTRPSSARRPSPQSRAPGVGEADGVGWPSERRAVLLGPDPGCTEADVCKAEVHAAVFVSVRFAYFCTAPHLRFSKISSKNNRRCSEFFANCAHS